MKKTMSLIALASAAGLLAACQAAPEQADGAGNVRMVATHEVANYQAFIDGYEAADAAAVRESGGVLFDAVYQQTDNPNDLMIVHDFGTMDEAAAYVESPDLKAAMEQLGVIEAPTITFYSK